MNDVVGLCRNRYVGECLLSRALYNNGLFQIFLIPAPSDTVSGCGEGHRDVESADECGVWLASLVGVTPD